MREKYCENTKKTFASGVLSLSLSTLLVKVIGLIYKIPMLTYLGSEGMGYFNSAYEIYALFCVIATAGLPVALSVLIAGALAKGKAKSVRHIYYTSFSIFLLIGVLGSLIMVVFARRFCEMIKSENAYACILSISPTVLLVCLSSALRGYFQGYQKMMPTAISQVLESVGKLVFGLLLARFALEKGYQTSTVAAFAGLGLTIGTAFSLLYLFIEKLRFRPLEETPPSRLERIDRSGIWRDLARLAIPMTLGASVVSMTKLIDMTMILRRLQTLGLDEIAANQAYGSYTTLALSIFGLIPALVNAVALPLVPMLSSAIAIGDRERQIQIVKSSYRLTSLFAIPSALGISLFSRPILNMLFGNDPETVAIAAPLLSCLGISIFLSCMITATNSVLHAYRVVTRPIFAMLAGAIIKIISAYFLIGNPSVALLGAPISSFLCNAMVVLINIHLASSLCLMKDLKSVFVKPALISTAAVGIAYFFYIMLAQAVGESAFLTLSSLFVAASLYLVFSCLFGGFCEADLLSLPKGDMLCGILQKLKLLPPKTSHQTNSISFK